MGRAGLEQTACLALQPALDDVAKPFGRHAVRQADVEAARRRGRIGGGGRPLLEAHLAGGEPRERAERDADRRAEELQRRAVAPDDPLGGVLQRTLPLLVELGEDPAAFFPHRGVDVAQGHPLRRAHRQALEADDEADAAPARALQQEGDAPAVEHELAVGARVAQGVGRDRDLDFRQALFLGVEQTALQHIGDAPEATRDRAAHR